MADVKFSQFSNGGDLETGDIIVGLRSGVNTQFNAPVPTSGGFLGVKNIASTSYTLLATDAGYLLWFNANSPITLTIPSGIGTASKGFGVVYSGSAYLTFAASGTTINGEIVVQTNQMVSAVEYATDIWQIAGNEGFESVITDSGTSRVLSSSDMDSFINFTDSTGSVVNITISTGIAPIGAQLKILFTGSNSAYFNTIDVPGVTFIGPRQIVKNEMVIVKQVAANTWQISNGNIEAEYDYVIGFTDTSTFAVNDVVYGATMTNQALFSGQVQYPTISKITDITTQNPIGVVIAAAGINESATLLERGVFTFTLTAGANVGDFVYVNNSGVLTLTQTSKPVGRILANGFSPQYSVYIDVHMVGSAAGKNITDFKTNQGAQVFDVSTYPLNIVNLTNPMPTVADFENATGNSQVTFTSFINAGYNAGDSLFYRNLSSTYNMVLKSAGGVTLATVPPLGAAAINVIDSTTLPDGLLSIAVSGSASGAFGTAAYKDTTDNSKSSVVALSSFTSGNVPVFDSVGSAADSGIAASNIQLKTTTKSFSLFQIFSPLTNAANYSPSTTLTNGASYPTFNFANGVDSEIQGQIELPDDYSLSNIINLELYWYANAGSVSQTVIFTLDAFIVSTTGNLDQLFGTAVTVTGTLGALGFLQVIPYSANITPGGMTPSNESLLKIRIRRTAAGGGTLAAPALLTGLKFKHAST